MGMAEERGLNPEHQGGQGPYCFYCSIPVPGQALASRRFCILFC